MPIYRYNLCHDINDHKSKAREHSVHADAIDIHYITEARRDSLTTTPLSRPLPAIPVSVQASLTVLTMAIVESGNYFIENVKQKNIAAVVDNSIGSPLMASVHMNNTGEVVCRYTLSIVLNRF